MNQFDASIKRFREARRGLESRWGEMSKVWVDAQQSAFEATTLHTLIRSSMETAVELDAIADVAQRALRGLR